MSSDLYFWRLDGFVAKKSIQEKFLVWVDRLNKIEIDNQIKIHMQLLPHLAVTDQNFKLDKSKLYVLKGD